jgi:hypothetical protein
MLSLAEAYIVAQSYLSHIGCAPSRVDEPVDGIVELEGAGWFSRVKYDSTELSQGAVLALLRAAGETENELALFAPSGFTHAALSVAETHNVALYRVASDGDIEPISTAARLAAPAEPFESPLAISAWESPEPEAEIDHEHDEPEQADDEEANDSEAWRDCPQCGTSHHRDARTCVKCGTDLRKRVSKLLHTPEREPTDQQVPPPAAGKATLRCKTCGSHDIELVATPPS